MKLTTENTSKIGRPVRVFDAIGDEVPYCIFCDTETGAVTRFKNEGRLEYISEVRPAPLRVEPI